MSRHAERGVLNASQPLTSSQESTSTRRQFIKSASVLVGGLAVFGFSESPRNAQAGESLQVGPASAGKALVDKGVHPLVGGQQQDEEIVQAGQDEGLDTAPTSDSTMSDISDEEPAGPKLTPTPQPTVTSQPTVPPTRTAERPTASPTKEPQKYYTETVDVAGIKIGRHESVHPQYLEHAAKVIRPMISKPEVQSLLAKHEAFLGIIPFRPTGKITDLPGFDKLEQSHAGSRLLSIGSKMAVGQEQIFTNEDGLRHEVGHAIYAVYIHTSPERMSQWDTIFNNAKNKGIYQGKYGMQNANEYFAELSKSYFGGKIDEYGGPDRIKANDIHAYNMLMYIYGPPPPVGPIAIKFPLNGGTITHKLPMYCLTNA